MTPQYKIFLTKELPQMLRTLPAEREPNFGLMTAQHMVEHLIYVTKSIAKRRGESTTELNKSQRYFRNFMDTGLPFEHRPRPDVTKDNLSDLRSPDMESAIQGLEAATANLYELFTNQPDFKSYNEMMGEFDLLEVERFNYQHGRWHAYQFGLSEEFKPLEVV